jgi:hypothetical protein
MKEMEALFKTLNANDGEKDENNDGENDENNVSGEDVSNVRTQMDAIKKYCSSFVFVTGCMYTENDDNFCWLHSYIIYGLYKNFGDLLAFLITTALDGVKAKHIVDYTTDNQLSEYLESKETWNLVRPGNDCSNDIDKLTTTLNGRNKNAQLEFPKDVKIKMKTFKSLLLDHYTDNLKTTKKSRRDIFCFGSIVENQIFNNCAIIDVGNESKEEENDDLLLGFFGDSDSDSDADETRQVLGIISKAG